MSTPNPFLVAGAPEIIAVLKAVQTFVTNLGTDPTKLAITAPAALQVLIGTVGLEVPSLVNAEFGTVQAQVNAQIQSAINKVAAASTPAPAAPAS